jgi:hypothetical protein
MTPAAHPVISELRDLCRLGLPAQSVMPIVMQTLHRLVPSCTNRFDWVNPRGQIVDYYTEPPYVPDAARLYFDEFYNRREREVMAPYSEQVRQGHGVLESSPPGRSFYRSDFYNLIWRPRGVHHSLEAVVRHCDRPVGALTLYRSAGEAPFGSRDRQVLGAAIPYLAQLVANGTDYRG